MTSFLINSSELCYTLVVWGCRVFIYSTLVICIGLLAIKMLGPRRAALRSSVLRFVLGAAFVCPCLGLLPHAKRVKVFLPLEMPNHTYSAIQRNLLLARVEQTSTLSREQKSSPTHSISSAALLAHTGYENSPTPMDSGFVPGAFSIDRAILYGSLSLLWILGAAFLLIRLSTAFVQTTRLRKHAISAPEGVNVLCHQLAAKIGIRSPDVLISINIPSPILSGIREPAILLPASSTDKENRHVLTHELAHLQRRDCVWILMGRLITALYFFQPLLWSLTRHLEETSEEVCDGFVLHYTGKRTRYARRLVEMAEELNFCSRVRLAGIGIVGLKSSLGRRVERILDRGKDDPIRTPKHARVCIHSIGIAMVLLLSLLEIGSAGSGRRARWQSFNATDTQLDMPSEGHVQALVETSSSHDANERARAVLALGKMGSQAKRVMLCLTERLEDEDWLVRKAAAQALAHMGSEAQGALTSLTRSLGDPEWIVRESSAYALGAIGSVTHAPVVSLIRALDDPEWQVRRAAAIALTALGSSAAPAVPRLSKALLDPEWQVRRPAAQALAAIGPEAFPAVSNLTQALGDEEWQVRQFAGAALASIGPRAHPAVSRLVVLLGDEEWKVRKNAALALGAIGPEAASAIPTLIECLNDPEWHCRSAATEALEKTAQGNRAAIPDIIDALLDPEWKRRKVAAGSLRKRL